MRFKNYLLEKIVRKSIFDPTISVIILRKKDPEYRKWVDEFKKYGLAIGVPSKRIIVWNGEKMKKLTNNEILFIEAHEYSHFKLGSSATEADCDWLAIINLWNRGKKEAAKVGINDFKNRHGFNFNTSDLKDYK